MAAFKVINKRGNKKKRLRLKKELDEHIKYLHSLKTKSTKLATRFQSNVDNRKATKLMSKLNKYGQSS